MTSQNPSEACDSVKFLDLVQFAYEIDVGT